MPPATPPTESVPPFSQTSKSLVTSVAGLTRDCLTFRPRERAPLTPFFVTNTLSIVGITDTGRTRARNEDSLSIIPSLGVAMVADGMGGHPGGDIASRIATETVSEILKEELRVIPLTREDFSVRMSSVMHRSVIQAHEDIRAEGRRQTHLEGMGTTLTALAVNVESGAYVLGHVGDSRAYRYRHGGLSQLTRDDTWVQERVEADQLTVEQARRHQFAHLITQCLGLEDAPTPHILHGSVDTGDSYLLCTDGLVGMLEDQQLEAILTISRDDPKDTLQALLDAANEAGGLDNITAALLTVFSSSDG